MFLLGCSCQGSNGDGQVCLPKNVIRIFTINDNTVDDWLACKGERISTEHLHAVYRRLVLCKVNGSLFDPDGNGLQQDQEDEENLAESFQEMSNRRMAQVS